VRFEWDETKRLVNIKIHAIDFVDLEVLFEGATVTVLDDRFDYGEERFVTLGLLNGVALVVIHTENDEVIRIISARKATKYEERNYFKEIED